MGSASDPVEIPPTEWTFENGDAGWKTGPGAAELSVANGRLIGRATTEVPVIYVERTEGLDDQDVLHEIVIKIKTSAGENLGVQFLGDPTTDLDTLATRTAEQGWPLTTPITASDEIRTYRINPASARLSPSIQSSSIRRIVLSPTDAAGARFEIESVRLLFRKEHLAGIPAGVGWQGLSEIYREPSRHDRPSKPTFA